MKPNLLIRAALKLTGYGWNKVIVGRDPLSVEPDTRIVIWKKP